MATAIPNPQWEKANQALEKLQSEKKVTGSGDEKKEMGSEKATATHNAVPPPEPSHLMSQPYGQFYPPYFDPYTMCGSYPQPPRPPAPYYGMYGPGPGPYPFPPYRPPLPRNVPPPPPPYMQNRLPPPPRSPEEQSDPQSKDKSAVNENSNHESIDNSSDKGNLPTERTSGPFSTTEGQGSGHFQSLPSNHFPGGYRPTGPSRPPPGFPARSPPYFQNGTRPPHSKQAPDAGGIRFQLPKRNMMSGNAIHNYQMSQQQKFSPQGPRHRLPDRFQQHKQAQSQYRPPSPTTAVTEPTQVSEPTPSTKTCGGPITATAEWPPALKAYVQRCFTSAASNGEKDRMERLLKQKLTDVFQSGHEYTTKWDVEPLPGQMRLGGMGNSAVPMAGKGRGRSRWSVAVDKESTTRRRTRGSPGHSKRSRSRSHSSSGSSTSWSRSRSRSPYYHRRKRRSHSRYYTFWLFFGSVCKCLWVLWVENSMDACFYWLRDCKTNIFQ